MFYDNKVVLVTGGSGFVGSHIVQELLKTSAKICIPVHKRPLTIKNNRIQTIQADLTKFEDCLRVVNGVDYIFHAAGTAGSAAVPPTGAMTSIMANVILTGHMLQAAWIGNVKRILIFGSSTGYPEANYPIKEEEMWNGPPHPAYFGYGWMRRYLELLGQYTACNSPVQVAIVRPTAIYGRLDNFNPGTSRVIPSLIKRAVEREDPFVIWGTGEEMRDFLHVTDLAKGCLLMLEKYAICEPVNIGYGRAITIKETVNLVLKALSFAESKLVFDCSKPSTVPVRMVDISKAKRVIGFAPQVSFEDGIRDTVEWYINERTNYQ